MELIRRLRRYRINQSLRNLLAETRIHPHDFIYPIFVWDADTKEIESMPGQFRWNIEDKNLYDFIERLMKRGLLSLLVFGVATEKDEIGSEGWNEKGVVQRFVKKVKSLFPQLVVSTDVCLCTWRKDGHCGVVSNDGKILNDETLEYLSKIAISHARSGADIVAPSDMMDGRVGYIRRSLDSEGFKDVLIMSYSAKYASALYGPFREAADSAPIFGDRTTYQMSPTQVREALLETKLDFEEGADILMVKPALMYLDVIKQVKSSFSLPVASFSVSGEYSMIKLGIKEGLFDERKIILELILAIKRAGSDLIITYFVPDILLKNEFLLV